MYKFQMISQDLDLMLKCQDDEFKKKIIKAIDIFHELDIGNLANDVQAKINYYIFGYIKIFEGLKYEDLSYFERISNEAYANYLRILLEDIQTIKKCQNKDFHDKLLIAIDLVQKNIIENEETFNRYCKYFPEFENIKFNELLCLSRIKNKQYFQILNQILKIRGIPTTMINNSSTNITTLYPKR